MPLAGFLTPAQSFALRKVTMPAPQDRLLVPHWGRRYFPGLVQPLDRSLAASPATALAAPLASVDPSPAGCGTRGASNCDMAGFTVAPVGFGDVGGAAGLMPDTCWNDGCCPPLNPIALLVENRGLFAFELNFSSAMIIPLCSNCQHSS